jgi:hypothetical protein
MANLRLSSGWLIRRWGGPLRRRLFTVPQNKDLKRLVRARMAESAENYTQALANVRGLTLDPIPPAWTITGSRAADYEAGVLPESSEGNRVARLRLRPSVTEPGGFGALVQSIAATRYRSRRVRYSATVRAKEVTGWAGLWLRIDGPAGTLLIDNMRNRPLRETTEWTEASIVLDVAEAATALHFGTLLTGAGAVDLARPRLEEVSEVVPLTGGALPDEPQALDFDWAQ